MNSRLINFSVCKCPRCRRFSIKEEKNVGTVGIFMPFIRHWTFPFFWCILRDSDCDDSFTWSDVLSNKQSEIQNVQNALALRKTRKGKGKGAKIVRMLASPGKISATELSSGIAFDVRLFEHAMWFMFWMQPYHLPLSPSQFLSSPSPSAN